MKLTFALVVLGLLAGCADVPTTPYERWLVRHKPLSLFSDMLPVPKPEKLPPL